MSRITVRVYGICMDDQKNILVTDEIMNDYKMTKFPGGGLHFGEGTIEAVKREFIEETGNEVEVLKHFYTTDFFQHSAFHTDVQIMAIYYLVKFKNTPVNLKLREKKFDFPTNDHGEQVFRWIPFDKLNEGEFELPIDKVVVKKLIQPVRYN